MPNAIHIAVDLQNPGQYFACCGLLELAVRYWGAAEGWFDKQAFWIAAEGSHASLEELLSAVAGSPLEQLDVDDASFSPLQLGGDFDLRLDWWNEQRTGGQLLRTWAGKQCVPRIARAMQQALADPACQHADLLNHGQVVYEDARPDKKVEPFYLMRRGESCHVLDIGFSPNLLGMPSVAYPAVEFLSLVGLQRFLPRCIELPQSFEFFTWSSPHTPRVAAAAACGALADSHTTCCSFAWRYRSDQRKHKAFTHATL